MNNRLESLLKLLENEPQDSFLMYGIALEYISRKDYKKAEDYLNQILNLDPGYIPAYMQYGQLKVNLNEYEAAKDIFKKGIIKAKETGDKHATKEMEELLDEL